ncbi:MAG: phosphoenolpyruvate--protein phosphotransferase, partial [Oscillospiraceae bacterium]
MKTIRGTAASPGIAFGPVCYYSSAQTKVTEAAALNPALEWQLLQVARKTAEAQLEELYQKALKETGREQAEILDVQRTMMHDVEYVGVVEELIWKQKKNAPYAVWRAGQKFSAVMAATKDEYMQARAADILDVSNRLVNILMGGGPGCELVDSPCIVAAEDLAPSAMVQLGREKVLAIVTRRGSRTSHTAILARSMGVPALVQTDIEILPGVTGRKIAVDAYEGLCYLGPSEEQLRALRAKKKQEEAQKQQLQALRGLASTTPGGKTVRLYANVNTPDELPAVLEADAEGIGLFRSEFLYLGRKAPPGEEEQFEVYRKAAAALQGKPVVVRTLDIGADKQAEYLNLPPEENPALGFRGVRVSLARQAIFETQLRAVYRASAFGRVSILLPMVASVWEVQRCKAIAAEVRAALAAEGVAPGRVDIGIMIETPAAVLLADELAKEADFFSVGTNDLTQYTLAADRQHAGLEEYCDPHHPAVLKMLAMVAKSAAENGIP